LLHNTANFAILGHGVVQLLFLCLFSICDLLVGWKSKMFNLSGPSFGNVCST